MADRLTDERLADIRELAVTGYYSAPGSDVAVDMVELAEDLQRCRDERDEAWREFAGCETRLADTDLDREGLQRTLAKNEQLRDENRRLSRENGRLRGRLNEIAAALRKPIQQQEARDRG